jgi:hypothetical protein
MTPKTFREKQLTPECEHPVYLPDEPRGYLAWHEWAEEKSKTHSQRRCPHCGLYAIWEPKGGE